MSRIIVLQDKVCRRDVPVAEVIIVKENINYIQFYPPNYRDNTIGHAYIYFKEGQRLKLRVEEYEKVKGAMCEL